MQPEARSSILVRACLIAPVVLCGVGCQSGQAAVLTTTDETGSAVFGPILGKKIGMASARPGRYGGSYVYRMVKYPTMEINVRRTIEGRAKLALETDGSVQACFGVSVDRYRSRSKYASSDRKHHRSQEKDRWLVGARGTWSQDGTRASVRLNRFWPDQCDVSRGEGAVMGGVELECVGIRSNERIPVRALVCRIGQGFHWLKEIAVNPADTKRSGPYTLQLEPKSHLPSEPGAPWLIFGANAGLHVESEDDRWAETPVVTFRKGAERFIESRFVPR